MRTFIAILAFALIPALASAQGNRLAYLDEVDPYYPHAKFPKLITPQWVGEKDVEAVVILAIDDMREPKKYEAFLRPILRRLKAIDGRAPVSIMCNQVDPKDPQLQAWLKEGLSLECHTLDHPCPFFKDGFAKAKSTYDKCVDLMGEIPNNKPVAFRMPCCDSLNTPSPRFFAEIFNRTTDKDKFLSIDSSVFNVFTSNDKELPRELVAMPDGTERFRKYLPKDRSFVNSIEDYPYPYVIGRLCWQFPCMTPSDWQAQHLHKPNNPQTVADWKAALDCTVIKKGVMTMVFHPHGWIKNDQLVDLVDYADKKYGKRVKFLNFREALERLNTMLSSQPLRHEETGGDNGIRFLDLDDDKVMDVVLGNDRIRQIRLGPFEAHSRVWSTNLTLSGRTDSIRHDLSCIRYGILNKSVGPSVAGPKIGLDFLQPIGKNLQNILLSLETIHKQWEHRSKPLLGCDNLLLRDIDGDGICECIVLANGQHGVFSWLQNKDEWARLPFTLPSGVLLSGKGKSDSGLRFIDLDGHGKLDIIFSNENEYGVYLFKNMKEGWSRKVIAGKAGDKGALPLIANKGENMGFFVHSGQLWWSNETTALLKDHVARMSIKELLK